MAKEPSLARPQKPIIEIRDLGPNTFFPENEAYSRPMDMGALPTTARSEAMASEKNGRVIDAGALNKSDFDPNTAMGRAALKAQADGWTFMAGDQSVLNSPLVGKMPNYPGHDKDNKNETIRKRVAFQKLLEKYM